MTFRDMMAISVSNLWRMKLRSFLTVSGVIIAVGASVAIISFAAGNQEQVTSQFEDLGLLSNMQVFPSDDNEADSTRVRTLGLAHLAALAEIPGVALVYPMDAFEVTLVLGDKRVETSAQAMPQAATHTRLLTRMEAGEMFGSDAADTLVISAELLEELDAGNPDSLVGRRAVLERRIASPDSAIDLALSEIMSNIPALVSAVRLDSIQEPAHKRQLLQGSLSDVARVFMDELMEGEIVRDTLVIGGILKAGGPRRGRLKPILIPAARAMKLGTAGPGTDPLALMNSIRSGTLFGDDSGPGKSFPRATLELEPRADPAAVRDSVTALGLDSFSYALEFQNIRRFFVYFNIALAAVGLIALGTASLGIVNTMIMAISERRREIGVLKALGADDEHIRVLFLAESAVIGLLGAAGGVLLGWLVSRLASAIARIVMAREGIPEVELFATPLWLVLGACGFGIVVAIVAGAYPSVRAARVDPVEALRSD